MTPVIRSIGMAGRLRLFAASLWVSLATAILCAVIPVGQPLSTALGSAFNPSTTAVALHSGSGQTRVTPKRFERDDTDTSKPGLVAPGARPVLPANAPEAVPPSAPAPAPAWIASAPRIARAASLGIAWPRGPPLA